MVADWPEFTGLLTSSFLLSPDLVSGHKIFAIPKESFIMYSRKAHKALTTVPWLPGPLASHWAGRRPESLMTVLSCVAIRCFSQLLMKGLSKFSMYLRDHQCGETRRGKRGEKKIRNKDQARGKEDKQETKK